MKSFFDFLDERCWPGYKSVRGKKAYSPGSCVKEDLRNWFNPNHPDGNWKRVNTKGEVVGDCAREPGEPKPKCMSQSQRDSLSKKEKASAVRRKRKEDPNAERQGAPINVKSKVNENMEQINKINTDASKTSMDYFWSDKKDSFYFWVVKPRMKIKVTDFNDPLKKELPVVRIDVKRFDGTIINQFTIKVKDFQTSINYYDGNYKEVFYDNMTNE